MNDAEKKETLIEQFFDTLTLYVSSRTDFRVLILPSVPFSLIERERRREREENGESGREGEKTSRRART